MKYAAACVAIFMTFGVNSIAWAHQTNQPYGRHMMWDGAWYGWIFGPLMMLAFLAIAVAVVVLVVRGLGGFGRSGSASSTAPVQTHAMDILKGRFARGEIDKEEFEEKRKTLDE